MNSGVFDGVTIILPSLNPNEKLRNVIEALIKRGFKSIVVINDGSDCEYLKYFPADGEYKEVTLLTHPENRGKGAALKTGFGYVLENRKNTVGVVTVDGDGQHKTEDIYNCASALCETPDTLILGVRDFNLPRIPLKSKNGNKMTSFIFRTGVGLKISDTQTGLRAIPFSLLEKMIALKGERYEFETNMLLSIPKHDIPYREVPIETVYEDKNSNTHFRPFTDSIRIYAKILKFSMNSLLSSLLDILLFYIFTKFVFNSINASELPATLIARIISNIFNFTVSRYLIFDKKTSIHESFLKYLLLATAQMAVSAFAVYGISSLFGITGSETKTIIKIPVDVALFFASYIAQKKWVFAKTTLPKKK